MLEHAILQGKGSQSKSVFPIAFRGDLLQLHLKAVKKNESFRWVLSSIQSVCSLATDVPVHQSPPPEKAQGIGTQRRKETGNITGSVVQDDGERDDQALKVSHTENTVLLPLTAVTSSCLQSLIYQRPSSHHLQQSSTETSVHRQDLLDKPSLCIPEPGSC